jgi:poly(ADP-ribose) glycohydrolase ARH3
MTDTLRNSDLRDKFLGAMVGAVIGDCFGAPLEFSLEDGPCSMEAPLSIGKVLKVFETDDFYDYTDDTAMARQLAASLVDKKDVDERDLAKRFTEEFYADAKVERGYGINVRDVFRKLWDQERLSPNIYLDFIRISLLVSITRLLST